MLANWWLAIERESSHICAHSEFKQKKATGMIQSGQSKAQFKYTKIFFIDGLLHAVRRYTKIYINDCFYYSKSKLHFSTMYRLPSGGIIM